ncbi:MAG: ABC transporter permease [Saprospiraceae bacterium]|jgi:ABC-2 type transport system permease protein
MYFTDWQGKPKEAIIKLAMEQLLAFVRKEVYHILRDRKTLLVLFGLPIAQILLFGFALSNEVKNTKIFMCDLAKDNFSFQLTEKVHASKYFNVVGSIDIPNEADEVLRKGSAHLVMVIPADFSTKLSHSNSASIQLITDGTNPNLASTIQLYLRNIINDFRNQVFEKIELPYTIEVKSRMLYNPQLKGAYTFVPGVMAMVLMIICTLMTSVSIVKEKELGNMEMLLVSPMNPLIVIFSKAIPYLALSLFIVTVILGLSVTLLEVPIRGNIFLLYGVCLIFIIASLALGLVISSITNSQQVAMMISLMGMMLPTIMFGGFMFPIENMPIPLQVISNIVPAKWFYYAISGIMIKGMGIKSVLKEISILLVYGTVFIIISYRNFKIRLE